MIHPDTALRFISKEKGYGVVATKLIPQGTITWVHDDLDQIISFEKEKTLGPFIKEVLHTYSFTNSKGNKVLCWDNGKYVNHSFMPSCFSTAYDFEIAIRDILPGEELTDDYGYLNVETPFHPIDEGSHRKTVYPDDILRYYKEWDKLIEACSQKVLETKQPLLPLIPSATWQNFSEAVQHKRALKSIKECHYQRD